MLEDPWKAWKTIRQIEKGSFAHHPPNRDRVLEDPDAGTAAADPKETLRIASEHCHTLFNHDDAPVHWPALDDVMDRDAMPELGNLPTVDEMNTAMCSLANNKAPGASGPPAEALKALPQSVHAAIVLPLFIAFGPAMLPTVMSGNLQC